MFNQHNKAMSSFSLYIVNVDFTFYSSLKKLDILFSSINTIYSVFSLIKRGKMSSFAIYSSHNWYFNEEWADNPFFKIDMFIGRVILDTARWLAGCN